MTNKKQWAVRNVPVAHLERTLNELNDLGYHIHQVMQHFNNGHGFIIIGHMRDIEDSKIQPYVVSTDFKRLDIPTTETVPVGAFYED